MPQQTLRDIANARTTREIISRPAAEMARRTHLNFSQLFGEGAEQTIYVSASTGDADNGGRAPADALPTITEGLALAAADAPAEGNRVTVVITDSAEYTEDLVVPSYVTLLGLMATLNGSIELTDHASVNIGYQNFSGPGTAVLKATGTVAAYYEVLDLTLNGEGLVGIANTAGVTIIRFGRIFVSANSFGIGEGSTDHIHVFGEDIYLTEPGATAFVRQSSGTIVGYVDHILELGDGVGGCTGFLLLDGEIDLITARVTTTTLAVFSGGGDLKLTAGFASGTVVNDNGSHQVNQAADTSRLRTRVTTGDTTLVSSTGAPSSITQIRCSISAGTVLVDGRTRVFANASNQPIIGTGAWAHTYTLAGGVPSPPTADGQSYDVALVCFNIAGVPTRMSIVGDQAADGTQVAPTSAQILAAVEAVGITNLDRTVGLVFQRLTVRRVAVDSIELVHGDPAVSASLAQERAIASVY